MKSNYLDKMEKELLELVETAISDCEEGIQELVILARLKNIDASDKLLRFICHLVMTSNAPHSAIEGSLLREIDKLNTRIEKLEGKQNG